MAARAITNRNFALRTAHLFGLSSDAALNQIKILTGSGDAAFAPTSAGPAGASVATPYSVVKYMLGVMSGAPQKQALAAAFTLYNAPVDLGDDVIPAAYIDESMSVPEFDDSKMMWCLGDSLVRILTHPEKLAEIVLFQVRHGAGVGMIQRRGNHGIMRFADYDKRRDVARDDAEGRMRTQSTMSVTGLQEIARVLRDGEVA
jgi:hypothetical protein